MNCVNCGADVQTPYCPACGQRTGVKRLTFRDTFADVWNNLSGFDGLFLRTLKDLTLRPGRVANSYITGVRIRYFGPVSYFFFMITLLLLWTSVLGFDFADLIRDRQDALSQPDRKGVELMTQWIGDNIKWFLFFSVPFQAVAARRFFFRRCGYNLVEHTVPLFYANGHLFWLSMVSVMLKKITGDEYIVFITLLEVGYFGFLYADLMRYQSRAKAFTKGIAVYFTGQILFIAVFTLIVMLSVLVLAVVNPEALELFRSSRP
ncbi:MAG: DUF3667 domain-containing protein [Cyclobacteriaceae bacterium]|nr:DUF3667 domain-containing protein [Cyclobacteriaceae bacterium]